MLCGSEGRLPRHIHFASLPGMKHRTVTVSSLGKTFSCTGWKVRCLVLAARSESTLAQLHCCGDCRLWPLLPQIGWCIGEERIIARIMTMVRWTQFCTATPLQVSDQTSALHDEGTDCLGLRSNFRLIVFASGCCCCNHQASDVSVWGVSIILSLPVCGLYQVSAETPALSREAT